ncbi:unnamed protein product [Ceratitis capitata]|uniref:(Mediterranean fruit fly) hypothetical protein n=1 Tax=Ceratitis capitata TaxID=7213 RepID=A0A811U2P8_CERCA|nr:unnamed protein product [Ceratitis capitata]
MLYEYNPGDLSMKTWDEPAQELLKRGMKLGLLANDSADAMMRYQRQSGYSSLKVFDAASRGILYGDPYKVLQIPSNIQAAFEVFALLAGEKCRSSHLTEDCNTILPT